MICLFFLPLTQYVYQKFLHVTYTLHSSLSQLDIFKFKILTIRTVMQQNRYSGFLKDENTKLIQ